MKEVGKVIEVKNGKAIVEFTGTSACSGCGAACSVKGKKRITEAFDFIGVQNEDTVEVEFQERKILKALFLSYGFPLLMFFLGYLLGSLTSSAFGIKTEVVAISLSFVSLAASYFLIRILFSKGYLKESEFVPVIRKRL